MASGISILLKIADVLPKWVSLIASIILGVSFVYGLIYGYNYDLKFRQIMYEHLLAVVGVPGAIITSYVLVNVLEHVSGPISIKGFGLEFNGASGPIIMWILVFLSIISALKILW